MRHFFFFLFTLGFAACGESPRDAGHQNPLPPADPAERARLEALCGCVEAPAELPTPPGTPELWCYDGCNWCGCGEDGRTLSCTARFCPDAGLTGDGSDACLTGDAG